MTFATKRNICFITTNCVLILVLILIILNHQVSPKNNSRKDETYSNGTNFVYFDVYAINCYYSSKSTFQDERVNQVIRDGFKSNIKPMNLSDGLFKVPISGIYLLNFRAIAHRLAEESSSPCNISLNIEYIMNPTIQSFPCFKKEGDLNSWNIILELRETTRVYLSYFGVQFRCNSKQKLNFQGFLLRSL